GQQPQHRCLHPGEVPVHGALRVDLHGTHLAGAEGGDGGGFVREFLVPDVAEAVRRVGGGQQHPGALACPRQGEGGGGGGFAGATLAADEQDTAVPGDL